MSEFLKPCLKLKGIHKKNPNKLTLRGKVERQFVLYKPCYCGSGKKFKFCCGKEGAVNGNAKE